MGKLRLLIDEMLQVERALGEAAIEARRDSSRRSEVIAMRRRFANALLLVSAELDEDAQLKADPELAREFRQRLSEMRSKIAVFQTKWPAVLLDRSDPEFDSSANDLRASNRTFTDWAQNTIRA